MGDRSNHLVAYDIFAGLETCGYVYVVHLCFQTDNVLSPRNIATVRIICDALVRVNV